MIEYNTATMVCASGDAMRPDRGRGLRIDITVANTVFVLSLALGFGACNPQGGVTAGGAGAGGSPMGGVGGTGQVQDAGRDLGPIITLPEAGTAGDAPQSGCSALGSCCGNGKL